MGFLGIFNYPFFYHNKKIIVFEYFLFIKDNKKIKSYFFWDFFWDFCYPPLSSFKNFKNTKKFHGKDKK
jgi:hypothetical protein